MMENESPIFAIYTGLSFNVLLLVEMCDEY